MIKVFTEQNMIINLSIKEAIILRDFLASFDAKDISQFNTDNVLGNLLTELWDNTEDY